ncbi:MAG: ABC transporter permease [Gemmatimonadales bacterium]|jgi:phospholipid/cholesterol/gamma-HCH transport system permease protein|nr:MAG: ABC transporter permease [Gemmatimonadales bacterium]
MPGSLLAPFSAIGRGGIKVAAGFGSWGRFMGSAGRSLRHVDVWARLLLGQMARIGVDSVPIALFIATFTGIVLALQASYTFTGAVPLYFVGVLVGKTMMLELGPVLTGLALSGRVGANISAELGTMRVTEQIDALETMAYPPMAYLVVPRVLAGTIMFPAVTLLAIAVGIVAGWITSLQLLDMTTPQFMMGLTLFFLPFDVMFAVIKATSFGFMVTSIGCLYGFQTMGGAEGVGKSTTRAVVVSSMVILVLDAFWAVLLL